MILPNLCNKKCLHTMVWLGLSETNDLEPFKAVHAGVSFPSEPLESSTVNIYISTKNKIYIYWLVSLSCVFAVIYS